MSAHRPIVQLVSRAWSCARTPRGAVTVLAVGAGVACLATHHKHVTLAVVLFIVAATSSVLPLRSIRAATAQQKHANQKRDQA